MSYFFTSESVSQGHPDKVADQISDALVDNFIARDPDSHCAIETLVTTGQVVVAGEVKSSTYVDIQSVVRETINKIGYTKSEYRFDGNSCGVFNAIHEQSGDIDMGVTRKEKEDQGAGDQGIMFGYATNETDNYMPATLDIAHKIVKELALIREEEPHLMPYLRPDAKSQVTIEYSDDNVPMRITDIVVSTQHDEFDTDDAMLVKIEKDVRNIVIPRVKEKCSPKMQSWFNDNINYLVNPTGKFVIGGPHGDTGLTGRKIIVDTYGGWGAHGGGAFCLDADTEYLSPEGWKKISEYDGGMVGQYDLEAKVTFVKPYHYHKYDAEKMYHIYNERVMDMVVSENHDLVLKTSQGSVIKKVVKSLINETGDNLKGGNLGLLPIAFMLETDKKVDMTKEEIRAQVFYCIAGGVRDGKTYATAPRRGKGKIIESVLLDAGINYTTERNVDNTIVYLFEPPVADNRLHVVFKDASLTQKEFIIEELMQWNTAENRLIATTDKKEADFVQWLAVSIGYGTEYSEGDMFDKNSCPIHYYDVTLRNAEFPLTRFSREDIRIRVEEFKPADGKMYCFTVPTGMFVIRRNNKVCVTGNCGKDVSKVDRSAAYMARYLAKNAVAAGIADRMLIQFSYAIGVAEPVSVFVDTYGTNHTWMTDNEIADKIKKVFDLRPYAIEQKLRLRNPIYLETAAYGHMGQEPRRVKKVFRSQYDEVEKEVDLFTWEELNDVEKFKREFKIYKN